MQREIKVMPNKDYYGDDCYRCEDLIKQGKTQKEIDEDHKDCHGWFHCGEECCGSCMICGS